MRVGVRRKVEIARSKTAWMVSPRGLNLPAVIVGAVVLDSNLDVHGGGAGRDSARLRLEKSRIKISAICTALSAAPLRRLSDTTQRLRPLATESSSRIRPTYVASLPAASIGVG